MCLHQPATTAAAEVVPDRKWNNKWNEINRMRRDNLSCHTYTHTFSAASIPCKTYFALNVLQLDSAYCGMFYMKWREIKTCWKIDYFGPSTLLISQVFFFYYQDCQKNTAIQWFGALTRSFKWMIWGNVLHVFVEITMNPTSVTASLLVRLLVRSFIIRSVVCFFAFDLLL